MTESDVLARLTRILRDLLGDESLALGMETRRQDVAGWDSFAYVNFIVAVEMDLNIKFGVADVEAFVTVGDVVKKSLSLMGAAPSR